MVCRRWSAFIDNEILGRRKHRAYREKKCKKIYEIFDPENLHNRAFGIHKLFANLLDFLKASCLQQFMTNTIYSILKDIKKKGKCPNVDIMGGKY